MIWFGKSFIKFCKSYINLKKLFSTRTCSSARVRVGINRPWKKTRVIKNMGVSAYPKVFTCLGDFTTSPTAPTAPTDYFADGANCANLSGYLQKMFDLYPVGVANTLGYAHPNSGDTMSSVMMGCLRTVRNGDFEVLAGDLVQWYWTFEVDCFHIATGRRHSIVDPAGNVVAGVDQEIDYTDGYHNPARAQIPARYHNDYQYCADPLNRPSSKARHVARVKPYLRDDDQPRLYDWFRVFAVAISSAKPNEMVDIKIGRQSL